MNIYYKIHLEISIFIDEDIRRSINFLFKKVNAFLTHSHKFSPHIQTCKDEVICQDISIYQITWAFRFVRITATTRRSMMSMIWLCRCLKKYIYQGISRRKIQRSLFGLLGIDVSNLVCFKRCYISNRN